MAREIERRGLLAPARRAELDAFVAEQRTALNVDAVEVVSPAGPLAAARDGLIAQRGLPIRRVDLRTVFENGQEFARTDRLGRGDVVTGGVPIRDPEGAAVGAVLVAYAIPRDVAWRRAAPPGRPRSTPPSRC